MNDFPTLFTPIRIGAMELRNRLVMSPMETLYGSPEGVPSERTIDYYRARARGGVALVTLGASATNPWHKEVPNALQFGEGFDTAAHRALTEAVHEHGAKIQPQIAHAGPDGLGPEIHGREALAASGIQSYLTGTTARAISEAEFQELVGEFCRAAANAREAGYDGIELHAAHGYMLLGSFLTPWRNARRDRYSARARDTRANAVAEVVQAIKREVGVDFPLTLRISGYERIAGGRESYDTQRIAPALAEAGVDAFHVSGGVIDRYVTQMVNGGHYPNALNAAAAAAVKRVVDVPVIAVGRIHTPALAERLLAEGSADLIAMGRPLLADPELPNKARLGLVADLRRCISCQNCIDAMETRFAMDCAVNPRTGREAELGGARVAEAKRVVVIGGGPGGLEAARVAAERGHRVDLYERGRLLGGAFRMAATVHPENEPFLDYLIRGVTRQPGVSLHLGEPLDAAAAARLAPDAVIVATGGRVVAPKIPGGNLPHVTTGAQLRELLEGRAGPRAASALPAWQRLGGRLLAGPAQRWLAPSLLRELSRSWLPFGRRIAIVGADLAAVELAEFLALRGRRVSLLEPGDDIAPEVGAKRRGEHMESLDRARVSVNTGVAIDRIDAQGVVLRLASGLESAVPADSVILAGAVEADATLYDEIRARLPDAPVHAVGDCTGLGLIQKATLEGARAACAI
jgi:2,4-dienoyl-CoA reductase (NADPH2)